MYNTNGANPSNFGGNSNLRPLNRLKDPYADSLLFGNDNNTTSVTNTSTSFQASSSLGLSPIKSNQPSNKKPITPSFERSFETDLHHFPSTAQANPLAGGNNAANGRRTVLEVNMKGRKQPPLSSSLFADYSGLDFKPNATAPSSSTMYSNNNSNPAITPQSANHRASSYGGSVTPMAATSATVTDDNDTNPIRSLHPHLSLSKISPAMDRLETLWSSWIIVYGYDPRVIQLHDILYHFQQYGEILKQYSSQQNWILLKYDSPVEADRATIQPCFFLPNHQTLLAVHRMNSQLAKSLQLHITSDDTIVSSTDSIPSSSTTTNKNRAGAKSLEELAPFLSPQQKSDVTSTTTGLRKRGREQGDVNGTEVTPSIEADIYIKPKRQKSVCERIVDYFWSS